MKPACRPIPAIGLSFVFALLPGLPIMGAETPDATSAEPTLARLTEATQPPTVRSVVAATNDLACRLHRQHVTDGNPLISAYSLQMVLCMALEGARGATRDEMLATMGFDEGHGIAAGDAHGIADGMRDLASAIRPEADAPYQLACANAAWGSGAMTWNSGWTARCRDTYQATFTTEDFIHDPGKACLDINSWTEAATNHRIKDVLSRDSVNGDTVLVLTNALYLRATWFSAFEKSETKESAFSTPHGIVRVPLMHHASAMEYLHADGIDMVALPYLGGALEMVLLLPQDSGAAAMTAIETALNAKDLSRWRAAARGRYVDLTLPRFTLASATIPLSEDLKAIGMDLAFDPRRADLGGLCDAAHVYISSVAQKLFIAVDEDGTEASAATDTVFSAKSVPPPPPVAFHCDRPFIYAVRHVRTGALLVLGRLDDPKQ